MMLRKKLWIIALVLAACADDEKPPREDAGAKADSGFTATPDSGIGEDTGTVDPCANVVCTIAGTICQPEDQLCHCGEGGPVCLEGEACVVASSRCELQPVCNSGRRWTAGTQAFRDATEDWGLPALGAVGTRLSVGDIDDDGYPDVFVRLPTNNPDDFAPGGTRVSWLLRNTGDKGFEDITESSGVRATRADQGQLGRPGQVTVFADVDNDGDLDVYSGMETDADSSLLGETSELLLNDGQGHFTLTATTNVLRRAEDVDAVAGASFVDFDRDGNVDLWVVEHSHTPRGTQGGVYLGDHLYRGDGTGGFEEVTEAVGLGTLDWMFIRDLNDALCHSRAWSAAACDLNGDGTPELLAASYGRAPNHLWEATRSRTGTVGYVNRSIESGYAYDENQTWTDNEKARCYCQANPGAPGCAGLPVPRVNCAAASWQHEYDREPFRLGGNSGATVCADVDNDGDLDLLTTEIAHWWAGTGSDQSELLLNTGEASVRFTRPGNDVTGLTRSHEMTAWDEGDITAAVFDFDNDAWPDIYIGATDYPGNRGLLFHQASAATFDAVPVSEGIDHYRSHGVVAADFDRDGDLDLLVGHSTMRCDAECYPTPHVRLFENLQMDSNWIQLELIGGTGSNRAAIGARVRVSAGPVTQTQEVGGGHGHYGAQRERVLHFGLGEVCEAEVTIRWPDAGLTEETFTLGSGYRYRIEQGAEPVVLRD